MLRSTSFAQYCSMLSDPGHHTVGDEGGAHAVLHVVVHACCSPASRHNSESENFADRLWSVGERDLECQNTAATDHRASENCGDRSHSCRD